MSRLVARITRMARLAVGSVLLSAWFAAPAYGALTLGEPKALTTQPGAYEKPAISANGKQIAFISDRGGAKNVWIMDLAGGEPVQVTHETRPEIETLSPAWSPKGDFLVYASNKGGTGSFDLWMATVDGQKDTALTSDTATEWMPAVSPDGKRVAYVSDKEGNAGLWVMDLDGKNAQRIAEFAFEPSWGPDSDHVAAYHVRGGVEGVYLFKMSGNEPPKLVLEGGRMPTWSPDGHYLVAVKRDGGGDRLWLADLESGADQPLSGPIDGLGNPRWGSSGPVLAFESRVGGQAAVQLASLTETRPITALAEPVAGASVRGTVAVRGTIGGEGSRIAAWRVEVGQGTRPGNWNLIAEGSGQAEGQLAQWQTTGLMGIYTIRLTAVTEGGETSVSTVPVTVYAQYGVEWVAHELPEQMTAGTVQEVDLQVRNIGTMVWSTTGQFGVYGSYQWIDETGRVVVAEGLRTELPRAVDAEETVALQARIQAPPRAGRYTLRYDLRLGAHTWFAEQGAQPLTAAMTVVVPYAVRFGVTSPPGIMVPGQIYALEVELTNQGVATWPGLDGATEAAADVVKVVSGWRGEDGGVVEAPPRETPLPTSVGPGESLDLMLQVQAPSVNGKYRLLLDLRDQDGLVSERAEQDVPDVPVQVSSPYGVQFGSNDTPSRMFPGGLFTVNVQCHNTGSTRWQATGPNAVRLSYQWESGEGALLDIAPLQTELPYDVLPGSTAAMAARVQSPSEAGRYALVWDLVQTNGNHFAELGNLPQRVPVMVGSPTHGVRWEQIEHPDEMVVGTLYTVELRLVNTGSMTWTPPTERDGVRIGYHWEKDGQEVPKAPIFTDLPREVNQGEAIRVTARVQAPDRPGTYTLKWDLYQGQYDYFSTRNAATLDKTVTVDVIYGAAYISHDTPAQLVADQRYKVNLRITNQGTIPWEAVGPVPVELSYRWYDATGKEVAGIEQIRTPLPHVVQPGESLDLTAFLKAPAQAGRYDIEWDLLFAGAVWFSEKGVEPLRTSVIVE